MKIISLFITTLALLSAAPAFALSHGMGNGGDAVVCYTDPTRATITSVKMFDYWEQDQVLHYAGGVDLGPANLTVQEKIELATNRIAKFDPELAKAIKKNALNLVKNLNDYLVTSYQLPEIADANPQIIPSQPNCYIEQFAVQYKDVMTGQRRFSISDSFYNHPSTTRNDQAGLLLHEAIYRFAILQNNATISDGVRFFNYFSATKHNEKIILNDYLEILTKSNLNDETCDLSKEPYLKKTADDIFFTCFNQILTIGNFEITLPENTSFINFFRKPLETDIYIVDIDKKFLVKRKNTDGSLNIFETHKFWINPKENTIRFASAEKITGSNQLFIDGPLNRKYECTSFTINLKTNNLSVCEEIKGQSIFDTVATTNRPNTWLIKITKDVTLSVQGSKNNLNLLTNFDLIIDGQYGPYERAGKYVTVDENLSLISAEIGYRPDSQMPVLVNGKPHHMTAFNVSILNGKHVLSFTSTPEVLVNPRIRNLRLIQSNPIDKGSISTVCKTNDLEHGKANIRTDSINSKGEQFYDLSTQSIVYKTDEDVEFVYSITCDSKKFETDNY